jgi:hypothetical protein
LNKYYNIAFNIPGGKTRPVRVTKADFTLTPGAITVQVNKMITSGVLTNDKGPVTSIKRVDKVTETIEQIIG